MKTISIQGGKMTVPAFILGCMRMPRLTPQEAAGVISSAIDMGVNFFDNATCYTNGQAEERFGEGLSLLDIPREKMTIQTKCGICVDRGVFDWSEKNILESVDDSLRRMRVEYLDILLLHRPDLIYEPEEVASAFDKLEKSGKVRYFGVSNLMPMQMEYLSMYVKQPILFNQLQLSLEQSQLLDQLLYMNNKTTDFSFDRDNSTLDYCRMKGITVQAWSPLQYGFNAGGCPGGYFIDDPQFPELNAALQELADKYGVSKSAIAVAWILRHPAKMQVLLGTMNPAHLADSIAAGDVELTREEWYKLYLASGKYLP